VPVRYIGPVYTLGKHRWIAIQNRNQSHRKSCKQSYLSIQPACSSLARPVLVNPPHPQCFSHVTPPVDASRKGRLCTASTLQSPRIAHVIAQRCNEQACVQTVIVYTLFEGIVYIFIYQTTSLLRAVLIQVINKNG